FGPPGARTFSHGGLRSRTSITGSSVFVFKTESLCHAPQATAAGTPRRSRGSPLPGGGRSLVDLAGSAEARFQRPLHPRRPRGRVLPREMHSALWTDDVR